MTQTDKNYLAIFLAYKAFEVVHLDIVTHLKSSSNLGKFESKESNLYSQSVDTDLIFEKSGLEQYFIEAIARVLLYS